MTINWNAFTPWTALAGGILIGLAASLLVLFSGRIAGISGILGGLLSPRRGDINWRVAFLGGIIIAPTLYTLFIESPLIKVTASPVILIAAGLLVGFGTRYGSGCTSGHGICGISRLSPRSMIATIVFMALGFLTVYLVRHVW